MGRPALIVHRVLAAPPLTYDVYALRAVPRLSGVPVVIAAAVAAVTTIFPNDTAAERARQDKYDHCCCNPAHACPPQPFQTPAEAKAPAGATATQFAQIAFTVLTIPHKFSPPVHPGVTAPPYSLRLTLGGRATGMDNFGKELEEQIPRLRRYARSLVRDAARADDLVQDSLLRALRKRHLFQPGTSLRAWLFTIMHHQYVNNVRSGLREGINIPVEDLESVLTAPATQGAGLLLRDFDRAMARLPEEQRQALLLNGLEGFSYEEVAAILDIPVGTVRSRLSRGREALRDMLEREQPRAAA
jgi:RNA polymerase sigma-70 factor, ECF subfamily